MFIGTDNFSNCKACGKKVPIRLRNCPHCRERDPQLRNVLGWRVPYTKGLDPSVESQRKSIWPFRIPIGTRFTIPSLIAIVVVAISIDYLFPSRVIELFGLSPEFASEWLGILYVGMFFVLMIWMIAVLSHRDW